MNTETSQNVILIVDDILANISMLSDLLEEKGFDILIAKNGKRAIQKAEYAHPDLILLDIMMPEMNGFDACRILKSQESTQEIPIIFMTALSETVDKIKGFELGAADYITKPIQPDEVLVRVNAHLNLYKLQRQLKSRTAELVEANQKITTLNEQLKSENVRMGVELEVARHLQKMLPPTEKEIQQIEGLDIACFMEAAHEVGGDFYDVLEHDEHLLIAIGDVTGHGLESGALAIMVQSSIRTLLANNEIEPINFFGPLNEMVYRNVQRMDSEKTMTLALLDYQFFEGRGILRLSGQHEEMIVVREGGEIERVDTVDLGFQIGLEENIGDFLAQRELKIKQGEVVVLYTDGITEAENIDGLLYGQERLCEIIQKNGQKTALEIQNRVIDDVRQFIGKQKVFDDITLLVLKQK